MRKYWQLDYFCDFGWRTRYFYGTEAAVQSRVRRYKSDNKNLKNISKSRVQFLKSEKNAHFIVL